LEGKLATKRQRQGSAIRYRFRRLHGLTSLLLFEMYQVPTDFSDEAIFEVGGEGWNIAYENYCWLEELDRLGKTKIGPWTRKDKHTAGLQAADLWSWELRRHFVSQMDRYPGLRPSLEKLICGVPDGAGFILDGGSLQSIMQDLKHGTSTVDVHEFSPESLPKLNQGALADSG
jgi:hypothetical protein